MKDKFKKIGSYITAAATDVAVIVMFIIVLDLFFAKTVRWLFSCQ